jgi:hypothetical protein
LFAEWLNELKLESKEKYESRQFDLIHYYQVLGLSPTMQNIDQEIVNNAFITNSMSATHNIGVRIKNF